MKIELITMPINMGSGNDGAENGPHVLIESGVADRLSADEVVVSHIDFENKAVDNISIDQKISHVASVCKKLSAAVVESLRDKRMPIVLGGDHSLTWGSLAGALEVYPDLYCIYIDAHGDINTPDGSPSGNVHGMHMSFLTGLHGLDVEKHNFRHGRLPLSHLKYFATRSLDPCETDFAERYKIDIVSARDINSDLTGVVCSLKDWLDNPDVRHIHLSFDVDALDPSIAPGTGVPEKDGISLDAAKTIIDSVLKSGKLVSMDVVEFDPSRDVENKTLDSLMEIFSII